MYSLHLSCPPESVDALSLQLWEQGTAGIRELDYGGEVLLIAGFEDDVDQPRLSKEFAAYSPEWQEEEAIDWVQRTHDAWPAREVGDHLFLAPPWASEPTPSGRVRVVHNPGLASGTGEHPCTQLALQALEETVQPGCTVADIGTGSGILAIASMRLGARQAVATDLDETSLQTAGENFEANELPARLVLGSAECLVDECADITVANISGTVLLAIMDDLLRITRPGGQLILTGLPEWELAPFERLFPGAAVTAMNEWRCLTTKPGGGRFGS